MEKKKIGCKRVTFQLHAPEASSLFLTGSFNSWNAESLPMKKSIKGLWKASISLETGMHEYRFLVDGEWHDDPSCQERRANGLGGYNCVVRV